MFIVLHFGASPLETSTYLSLQSLVIVKNLCNLVANFDLNSLCILGKRIQSLNQQIPIATNDLLSMNFGNILLSVPSSKLGILVDSLIEDEY